jgi:hypothetical protein
MSRKGFRKPGLWFTATKAEIEQVTARMKKTCTECGDLPTQKRLKVVKGSGRHQTVMVFCGPCAKDWILRFKALCRRAVFYLNGDVESVRESEE